MSFADKLQAAKHELRAAKLWKSDLDPLLHRILARFGWDIRPLHYNSFGTNFFLIAISVGGLWGTAMWLTSWRFDGTTVEEALIFSLAAGAFFGIALAKRYQRMAKLYQLSRWEEL